MWKGSLLEEVLMLFLIEGVVGVVICGGADVLSNCGCGRGGYLWRS